MAFEVTVAILGHVSLEVKIHVTMSPLAKDDDVYVAPPVPAFTPFTCHWYVGVAPPLIAVAVYVTEVPAQIEPEGLAAIDTEGVTTGFTIIVIALDVAVVGLAQDELDVKIQVTISLFVNAVDVYVALPVPTLLPFTCH